MIAYVLARAGVPLVTSCYPSPGNPRARGVRPDTSCPRYVGFHVFSRMKLQTLTETYGELSRLFGDYYALSVTQLFAFSEKHAAFERNGNMSLFEKFELAREVSEICDSVVPLIKVVIVEGGKRDDALVNAMAATERQRVCWDDEQSTVTQRHLQQQKQHQRQQQQQQRLQQQQKQQDQLAECCRNPFGAIMEDDVDRTWTTSRRRNNNNNNNNKHHCGTKNSKCIELQVYSRSVNYFQEPMATAVDDEFRLGCRLTLAAVPIAV